MRLTISLLFALSFLAACAAQQRAAEEPGELAQQKSIANTTRKAFVAGDFGKLEALSTEYRERKARLPSGLWKLTVFYSGIDQALPDTGEKRESTFAMLEYSAKRWTELYPLSPAAHIAYAKVLIGHGWAYRGSGYAASVRQEDWQPFFRYVALARDYLEKQKSVAASDPEWYGTMLKIARVESWDQDRYDALLNEALEREPLYYDTYFEALQYLLPKWGGNARDIERFAQDAVQRTSAQEGRGMYARIYWVAAQSQFGDGLFTNSLAAWTRMKAGFDDVIAKYPDAWNMNNYAKFACLARDKATTQEILKRVQALSVVPEAWEPEGLFKQCSEWASVAPVEKKATWSTSAPVPLWPRPGAVLDHFPRNTEIEWQPVPGAAYYSVEIDCMSCCGWGKWCSEVGGQMRMSASHITRTSYRFVWVGANSGRWRVWAVSADGKEGGKTPWQEFTYKQ